MTSDKITIIDMLRIKLIEKTFFKWFDNRSMQKKNLMEKNA